MENGSLIVKAKLEILPTEETGRTKPIKTGYSPNHNFGGPENNSMFLGRIEFNDNEWHYPGSTSEVTITFINSPGLEKEIKSGRKWRIQEAKNLVAEAEVIAFESKL